MKKYEDYIEKIIEKDELWDKESLENGITLKMIKKINSHLNDFVSKTHGSHISRYFNGFHGVGILDTPTDHLIKGINTILFSTIGFNKDGSNIGVICNLKMTIEEAEDIYNTFGKCIKKYKKLKRKNG